MSVGDLVNREERPAYVQFERRAIEDKAASIRDGTYRAKDVDFALVTPPYSKDCVEQKVDQWLINMERNVRDGRVPETWANQWKEALKRWREGQEMPVNGTPIKGWGVISPAQQATIIGINCRTVEDLAAINDEGIRRLGMGAIELRDKAKAWLASMNEHGSVAVKMAAIEQENRMLKSSLETMAKQIDALKTMLPDTPQYVPRETNEITASDLLDEPMTIPTLGAPPQTGIKRKPGRPVGSGKRV
jgi:hypothetical protein